MSTALVPTASPSPIFADPAWVEWLRSHGNSDRTRQEYARDLKHTFSAYLASRDITGWSELTAVDVIAFPGWLRERGYSEATQARVMSVVRTAIKYAYVLELVDARVVTVAQLTKGAKVDNVSPRNALDKGQVRELLATVDTTTVKGRRDHAMLAFLLYLGLRSHELCSLTLGSFHKSGAHLVIAFYRKGHKRRELPVRPILQEAIHAYLAAEGRDCDLFTVPLDRADEVLFRPYHVRAGRGKEDPNVAITTRSLRRLVEQHAAMANVPCDTHTLRLTAATNAIEAGAPVDVIQELLGHANISTTIRYIKRHDTMRKLVDVTDLINY